MRILIIGGTNFSGPHIVRRLASMGHEVIVFHRGKTDADIPDPVRHILGDRNHLEDHAEELHRLAPEIVLDMIPINEGHARTVIDVFTGVAKRVVAISSQDVYRAYGKLMGTESCAVEPIPLTEESPVREKLYPYREMFEPGHRLHDYDKILIERVYLGSPELPGTVLRYPMVYGPRDPQHRLHPYLKRMDDQRPAILLEQGLADWRWTKGYVEEMAAAVVLAVTNECAAGKIYNVGEPETLTEIEWVRAIAVASGWSGRIVLVPKERAPEQMLSGIDTEQQFVIDSTAIRRELGYAESVPRDEALRRTVAWLRENPPEQIDPKDFDYAAEDVVLRLLEGKDS